MNKIGKNRPISRRVIIAYSGTTPFWCLRWLKPGFRHCTAIVQFGPYWILADGLSDRLRLSVMDAGGLAGYLVQLARLGFRFQVTSAASKAHGSFSIAPYTCVEVVKRVLGVKAVWTLTPYQLFKHVKKTC